MFFVLLGNGNNGKSAMISIIESIFSGFYANLEKCIMFKTGATENEIQQANASIVGKRIGVYSDPDEYLTFNEADLKKLVGAGDLLTGKLLYKDKFKFIPIVKAFVLTNKLISLDTSSKAMLSRLHYMNMSAEFMESEKKPD
jgi:phage/plasmid-associated DNA primase